MKQRNLQNGRGGGASKSRGLKRMWANLTPEQREAKRQKMLAGQRAANLKRLEQTK